MGLSSCHVHCALFFVLAFGLMPSAFAADWISTPKSVGSGSGGTCEYQQQQFDGMTASSGVDAYKKAFWQSGSVCGRNSASCPGYSAPPAGYSFDHAEWVVSETSGVNVSASKCVYTDSPSPPPTCQDKAGQTFTGSQAGTKEQGADYQVCRDGCEAVAQGAHYFDQGFWTGVYKYTGSECASGQPSDTFDPDKTSDACPTGQMAKAGYCYPVDEGSCPAGSVTGTVNDRPVCVKAYSEPDDDTPPPPESSGEPPAPGDRTPGANTGTCPDGQDSCGSGSGSKSGYCDPAVDSGCVSDGGEGSGGRNTGTCPDGAPDCGSGSGSEKGKCDPSKDADCSPSSVTGGTCSPSSRVQPSCKGDAVSCAVALNTWQLQCAQDLLHKQLTDETLVAVGRSIIDGGVPSEWSEGTERGDFSDFVDSLDASGSGFGGETASCPPDKVVHVQRIGDITFPLSYLCEWAQLVRGVVIFLGWLSAAMIGFAFLRSA